MSNANTVIEYKCPCCDAPLLFEQASQKLTCNSCGNEFDVDAVAAFNEPTQDSDSFSWEAQSTDELSEEEQQALQQFSCPSCGGILVTDLNTVATFCPYCENPAILPARASQSLRPDGVLPFLKTKQDAQNAFNKLCKNKPLLPKGFHDQQRIEKITGVYVPFWLYNCDGDISGRYRATRVRSWSDANYHYTKTSHYLLLRQASASFKGIPMDASSKMDNMAMESIEPFDYNQIETFDTAYLSGFLADKYDVAAEVGTERIKQRVSSSLDDLLAPTFIGYSSVIPTSKAVHVNHGAAKYVLLPVWMLVSKYKGETYTFAMNGQTGTITGKLPICPKRSLGWFAGVTGAAALVCALVMLLL